MSPLVEEAGTAEQAGVVLAFLQGDLDASD